MLYSDKLNELNVKGNKLVWKLALYVRLSVADGNDESLSVSNQKKLLMEFVNREFLEPHEIADFYVDDGLTGTDDERIDFQRMINDIKNGKVNCIICKNLSRIFRNYSDQGYFLEEFFPLYGTRFITLGDPKIDTLTEPEKVNGLEVPITGVLNDRYAQKTSMDIRRTFKHMADAGEFLGGFPPYGYIRNPEDKYKFLVDEEAAAIVKDIFRLYVYEGYSKRGIVLYLNELGVPNPSTYKQNKGYKYRNPRNDKSGSGYWSTVTINHILKNRTYLGDMVQRRTKVVSYKIHKQIAVPEEEWSSVENTHEPIIERETFDKAQNLLKKRGRATKNSGNVHIFSGLIRCADCKRIMQRKQAGGNVYFVCKTYYEHKKEACTRHSIREDDLCKVLLQTVQKHIELMEGLDKMAAQMKKNELKIKPSNKIKVILEDTEKRLEKVERILDEAYLDWKQQTISQEQYIRVKEQMEGKQLHYKNIVSNLKSEIKKIDSGKRPENEVVEYFQKHKNIKSLNRALLVELVDSIYVHEDKSITIAFNYADPFKGVVDLFYSRK